MAYHCFRCESKHEGDDPQACPWVRAIEYDEFGRIRRIEYHSIEGVQAPVIERAKIKRDDP